MRIRDWILFLILFWGTFPGMAIALYIVSLSYGVLWGLVAAVVFYLGMNFLLYFLFGDDING